MAAGFRKGDPVVYVVTKQSERPGPRAAHVHPAPQGETYRYDVEKYWRVKEVLPDGKLVLITRRGKEHTCAPGDPKLRKPSLFTRLFRASRFPEKPS